MGLFDSSVRTLHGGNIADMRVSGSSLIKAKQWLEFLDDWAERLRFDEPWVLFLLHATMNFHQAFGIMSRRLRKNEYWVGGMTMEEQTVGLVEDASRRLAWFEKQSETLDKTSIPAWARFMFAAIEGGFRMQVRLARECEQVLRKGHLLVNVSPRVDTVEKAQELGEEVEK